MADDGLSACNDWCSSQLRIVLLGGRNSGKNVVGNLLLGKEEFVARERTSSSRRLGVVAGRWLTVVDTPGWWCDFSACDTTRLVKREIVSGVSLCPPGPHVFLVVLKASSAFSERRRRAVEEHVALLGEGAWDHCVVVLAAEREHRQVEGCEGRGREALRWLAEKCGRRCHSVNLDNDTETTKLLGAIHKFVAENGNKVYEMQEDVLRANAEEKRAVEKRAQLRLARVKERRSLMRERLRPVTDIRIVLLGAKGSGKTSALNTILGRRSGGPPGRTARCQVGRGVVFGRELTVVDTPGWWMNYFCGETPVFDRRELVLSLSLCPPGPHVFLLVVRADRAFTETYRRAAQEHLELIGGRIWSRVLLLFTFGDWLGGATAEQHVESEGAALGWLAGKCGDRYHVLDGGSRGGGFEVRELIGKLEEMMTGWDDRSWHYEIERKTLEQLEAGVRREREQAQERLTARRKQRQTAKSLMEKLNPSPELRLVLVGCRKSGKSSCGNTILGQEAFDADAQTTSCVEKRGWVGGRTVTVLDTPGCSPVTSDLLTPPSALLLVVNASASFTDAHSEALGDRLDAVGEQWWGRAAVLFSHGDWLGDTSIEERIESEGEPLRRLVGKCGNRYHVLDNTRRDHPAQVFGLVELLEEMVAGERMDALRRGQHMCNGPSSTGGGPPDVVTLCRKDLMEATGDCHQLLPEVPPSPASSPGSNASQVVALRPRRGAGFPAVGGLLSHIAATLSGSLEWAGPPIDLQLRPPLHHPRQSGENCLIPARHAMTLVLSSQQQQQQQRGEEEVFSVHTLSHPVLRERTLRKLWERGGLQALIDQWGDSSLAELEAFIDSYFEMVWEQTMGSLQSTEADSFTILQQEEEQEEEEEVLSSIDRKLSKLELLEEIKSDLGELRQSLERSWRAIEELRHKNKHGPNNTQ